jgi:hypothetical protein
VEDEMAGELKIRVNERESTVTADLDTPLLYVLSNELGLQDRVSAAGSPNVAHVQSSSTVPRSAHASRQSPRP